MKSFRFTPEVHLTADDDGKITFGFDWSDSLDDDGTEHDDDERITFDQEVAGHIVDALVRTTSAYQSVKLGPVPSLVGALSEIQREEAARRDDFCSRPETSEFLADHFRLKADSADAAYSIIASGGIWEPTDTERAGAARRAATERREAILEALRVDFASPEDVDRTLADLLAGEPS